MIDRTIGADDLQIDFDHAGDVEYRCNVIDGITVEGVKGTIKQTS